MLKSKNQKQQSIVFLCRLDKNWSYPCCKCGGLFLKHICWTAAAWYMSLRKRMRQLFSVLVSTCPSACMRPNTDSVTATGPTLALSWSLFQPPRAKQLPYSPHRTVFRHSTRFSSKGGKNALPYICCQWSKGMHFPRTLSMELQMSAKTHVTMPKPKNEVTLSGVKHQNVLHRITCA